MDKKRLQKLCIIVFTVAICAIIVATIADWIGSAVVDQMMSEMVEDELGIMQYATGSIVKMVRGFLTGGSLSFFTSIDSIMGGSTASGFMPYMDDFLTSGIKEMLHEELNPFVLILLYIWAFAPHIRDIAIICGIVSAVVWYLSGGQFESLKKLLSMTKENYKKTTTGSHGVVKVDEPPKVIPSKESAKDEPPKVIPSKESAKEEPPTIHVLPATPAIEKPIRPVVLPVTWTCSCGHSNPEEKGYCLSCKKSRYSAPANTNKSMSRLSEDDLL